MESYEYYLDLWHTELKKLKDLTPDPSDVDSLQSEEDKKKFILAFRDLTKVLTKLNTFTEFEFKEENLGMNEQSYQDYKSKYFTIYESVKRQEEQKTSILADIDFGIELMNSDKINVSYIMNLIREIDLSDKEKKVRDIKNIITELDRADNEDLRLKVDLLKEFLNQVVPNLNENDDIDSAYEEFDKIKREEEVDNFANEIGLNRYKIKNYISEYEYSGIINRQEISDEIKTELKPKFTLRRKMIDQVKNFIYDHVRKFA